MSMRLAVCADDFGQGQAIDQGILQLLHLGRLQAVSCLVNGPTWAANALALAAAAMPVKASIGLHFNLTQGAPLSSALLARYAKFPGLPAALLNSHLRRLPLTAVAEELHAQLHAFSRVTGHAPQHIDGHQHVHHLPGVRTLILAAAAATLPPAAVRRCAPALGPGAGFKRWVIEASGGRAMARSMDTQAVRSNPALVGVYDFKAAPPYRQHMQGWLARLTGLPKHPGQGALLFCHPARVGAEPAADDTIGVARQREMAYLCSEDFATDLAAAGVTLGPVW